MRTATDVLVFLGPSLPRSEAAGILDATYLPPVKRGDLESIGPDATAVIIDGVFDQDLSVSPAEILDAIGRGVRIFGGGSMGALRAAEIPAITGIGKIFEWYRDGIVSRDDEVALLFDPETSLPVTIPSINIRYAVERLCSLGTIDAETGRRIVDTALNIPFKRRTYSHIFSAAGLAGRVDSGDLIAMLKAYDLKAQDARSILEAVARMTQCRTAGPMADPLRLEESRHSPNPLANGQISKSSTGQVQELLIWETGDKATLDELLDFMIFTGQMNSCSGPFNALATALSLQNDSLSQQNNGQSDTELVQSMFDEAAKRWGWISPEEARITLSDLKISLETLSGELYAILQDRARLQALVTGRPPGFLRQFLSRLFMDGLALKRELMRLGSLRYFSARSDVAASPEELDGARRILCKLHQVTIFSEVTANWERFGLVDKGKQDTCLEALAKARRAVWQIRQPMIVDSLSDNSSDNPSDNPAGPFLADCPKRDPNARQAFPVEEAHREALRLGELIGVSRIGMIGELSGLPGAFVAQAARPGNAWSSSYGSGKSLVKEGAVVGSIMEELEKWAQEKFVPSKELVGSYLQLGENWPLADPSSLDLPHDTNYTGDLILSWHPAVNLLDNTVRYIPADLLTIRQEIHDIMFSRRGARKVLATNGLGAGFTREEAVLHGLCELVERHAQRMAELRMTNPGCGGDSSFRFVCLDKCGNGIQQFYREMASDSTTVRVLDITSEIAIPTFQCVIMRNFQRAEGFGTHPNTTIAIEMAMLEAYQTIASYIAGGREDLSIKARSLGRHERPRPISAEDGWFWLNPDAVLHEPDDRSSFVSGNVFSEIDWSLRKMKDAGFEAVLAIDITPAGIAPAHVVKMVVPGLETNSPFYLGPRGRALLLADMLPSSLVLQGHHLPRAAGS